MPIRICVPSALLLEDRLENSGRVHRVLAEMTLLTPTLATGSRNRATPTLAPYGRIVNQAASSTFSQF